MEEKVWVIDDPAEKRARNRKGLGEETTRRISSKTDGNPADAFSLSLLCWGAGQFYNRQWKMGTLLVLLEINYIAFLLISAIYWKDITHYLSSYYLTSSDVFFVASVFYFFGILIWFANALQAYHRALPDRKNSFMGVESRIYPALCSFMIPGWGQVLNGQIKKAYFFLCFSVVLFMAILLIPMTLLAWSVFEPSITSIILEFMFTGAFFSLPVLFVVWIISVYDALKVSNDELKKESWWKRMKYARNRVRLQGFDNTLLPQLKLTGLLSLILVISLIVGYFFFPKDFAHDHLSSIRSNLATEKMVIIPHLIDRIIR